MRTTLNISVSGFLNGAGNLTLKVGPLSAREVWYPDNVAVSVTTDVAESICAIYAGDTNTKQFRDSTGSGSFGDSTGKVKGPIKVGSYVWAIWSGGDAGAQATLTVTGEKDV